MNAFLLFLHFVGLAIGAGGGTASGIVMQRALKAPPEQAQLLRSLGPTFANVSAVGLALLWITGITMAFTVYGGFANLPWQFSVKLFFVLVLTGLLAFTHMTYAQIRRTKNPALGRRLALVGPLSGLSFLLIILFAAFAFDVH
jgi:hypothetical protein